MTRWIARATLLTLGAFVVGGTLSSAAAGPRIDVNIGVPVPVVVAPPPPVVVAPAPVIAPGAPVYFYGGSYYTFYNGAWFVGGRHAGPWGRYAGPPPWERHRGEGHWREGHLRGPRH